ncbi:MAG: methyltransferase family protein [Acidobacteriaceae bacterium]
MKILRAVLFVLGTLLIYLVIPLLGWGLAGLQAFFVSGPRLGYALVVWLFSLAVGLQAFHSASGIRGGKGQAEKFVFRQHVVRLLLILSLYLALFFIPFCDRRSIGVFTAPSGFQWLGIGLCAAGYALIFLSGLALGRQYSQEVTIQADHQLITHGAYRLIRHPRYLGIILLAVGVALVFRSWIGLVACFFFTAVLVFRVSDEELLMHQEFGVEWEAYCRRSWRLIPYVY